MRINSFSKRGFTLVEIIVVVILLGAVAAIVVASVNPIEQVARGRDGVRKNTVGELSTALQAYVATQGGTYPTINDTWITTLKNADELKTVPQQQDYRLGTACAASATVGRESNICYQASGEQAIIYARLESAVEQKKCNPAPAARMQVYNPLAAIVNPPRAEAHSTGCAIEGVWSGVVCVDSNVCFSNIGGCAQRRVFVCAPHWTNMDVWICPRATPTPIATPTPTSIPATPTPTVLNAFFLWSSKQQRSAIVCLGAGSEPVLGQTYSYVEQ